MKCVMRRRLKRGGRTRKLPIRSFSGSAATGLMRHSAQGITLDMYPKTITMAGISMALNYYFDPGSPRDGVTSDGTAFALNQVDERRCQWLVPGMLKEKIRALVKSLPPRLRRNCIPIPEYAEGFLSVTGSARCRRNICSMF